MKRLCTVLAAVAVLTLPAFGQMSNDPVASLVINGVDGPPPNTVNITLPNTVDIQICGNPGMDFVLVGSLGISIGEFVFLPGVLELDVGPQANLSVIMDGTNPSNPFNVLANTGTGCAQFSLTAPVTTPTGSAGALQAFVIDFTAGSPFVFATAASEIVFDDPVDYGEVNYTRGSTTTAHDSFTADGATGVITNDGTPSSSFDVESINMSRREFLHSNTWHRGASTGTATPLPTGRCAWPSTRPSPTSRRSTAISTTSRTTRSRRTSSATPW